MRRWVVILGTVVGLLLTMPAAGSIALGHAQLLSTEPGSGDVLLEEPDEMRLVFSEPLEPSYSSVTLKDGDDVELARNIGAPDPTDPHTLLVPFEKLPDGGYLIEWRALSAADGHTTQGFTSFGIRDFPLEHGLEEDGTTHSLAGTDGHGELLEVAAPLEVAGRSIGYLGMLLALGLLPVGWLAVRPGFGRVPRGLVRGQALAIALGSLGGILLAIQISFRTELELFTYLTTSRTGTIISQRILLGLVGLAITLILIRFRRPAAALVVGGLTGAGSLILLALAGHASVFASPAPMVAMIVHLAAAGIWLSGIVVLVVLARLPNAPLASIVPRFSALALLAIALLAATGVYADWVQTRDVFSIATNYQFYLAIKIALVVAALGLGGLNFLDGGRGVRWLGGLRRRVGAEVGVAALVLLVTANLGSGFPPASDRAITLEAVPTSAIVANERSMRLELGPGRPGPNRYWLFIDPAPSAVDDLVSIELDRLDRSIGPQRLSFSPEFEDPTGQTYYTDGGLIPPNSTWTATVIVRSRDGVTSAYQRFEFSVNDQALVEGRALPPLDPGWVIGLLLLCASVLGIVFAGAGGVLPRVERVTGRLALGGGSVIGGIVGLVLVGLGGPL